jgi:hypothetical protein
VDRSIEEADSTLFRAFQTLDLLMSPVKVPRLLHPVSPDMHLVVGIQICPDNVTGSIAVDISQVKVLAVEISSKLGFRIKYDLVRAPEALATLRELLDREPFVGIDSHVTLGQDPDIIHPTVIMTHHIAIPITVRYQWLGFD